MEENKQPESTHTALHLTEKKSERKKQPDAEVAAPPTTERQEQQVQTQVEIVMNETIAEVAMNEPAVEPVQPAIDVATEEDNMTITLTVEEVNEKYLTKKTIADATTPEKKSSTLRKLLDKAYDLKHNQDPVGELRQKKNEILALNFKNDKRRQQQNNK
ncbi:MAG: hypothetical protein HC859_07115 [Bacteroidia bacterium]|nr:hypothetical protein [Bacteroidia bacterium]